jgi:RNA-directed DNA polymerase
VGYGYIPTIIKSKSIGTPQGGVISPLLANIYLHELDEFVFTLKSQFDKGVRKKQNPAYTAMIRGAKVDRSKMINPLHPKDENFKRLNYIRYADDFVIGVIGSYSDCVSLRDSIKE